MLSVGWALTFRSLAGVLLVGLMMMPLVARIRSEEALLHSQFGKEHDACRARAWRLVPGLYRRLMPAPQLASFSAMRS